MAFPAGIASSFLSKGLRRLASKMARQHRRRTLGLARTEDSSSSRGRAYVFHCAIEERITGKGK